MCFEGLLGCPQDRVELFGLLTHPGNQVKIVGSVGCLVVSHIVPSQRNIDLLVLGLDESLIVIGKQIVPGFGLVCQGTVHKGNSKVGQSVFIVI